MVVKVDIGSDMRLNSNRKVFIGTAKKHWLMLLTKEGSNRRKLVLRGSVICELWVLRLHDFLECMIFFD